MPEPLFTIFQGYDTFTGDMRGTAVGGAIQEPFDPGIAANCTVCTDLPSLAEALNISAPAFASSLFGSADQKLADLRDLRITPYSVSVVLYTNYVVSHPFSNDGPLNPAVRPDPNTDPKGFFLAFGDSYLSDVAVGTEYYAVYVFYAQSPDDQMFVMEVLNQNGIMSGSLPSQQSLEWAMAQAAANVRTGFTDRARGLLSSPTSQINNAVDYANGFRDMSKQQQGTIGLDPVVCHYETTGYERVPGINSFAPIQQNRSLFLGAGETQGLVQEYSAVREVQNQIVLLQGIYQFYKFSGDGMTSEVGTQIDSDLSTLDGLRRKIDGDPTAPNTLPAARSLGNGTPDLKFALQEGPDWGGPGGSNSFRDVRSDNHLVLGLRYISSIQVRGNKWIDALTVTYSFDDGSGKPTETSQHGGDGGFPGPIFSLDPGEFISNIKVGWGKFVNQLAITTNVQEYPAYPPNPQSYPSSAFWLVPAGQAVVAFQGRYGEYLDHLQPILLQLLPANWVPLPEPMIVGIKGPPRFRRGAAAGN